MDHSRPFPHDPIEAIADDVFLVRGSIRLNPTIRITRNMAIVRHGGELTLVDPIRLDEAGEKQLRSLGTVRRLVRLGALHGLDDPYYVDTFHAELWAQPGGTKYTRPAIDRDLSETGALPFPGVRVFCFRGTTQPEAALLLEPAGGILLACDSLQHYGDYRYCNLPARLLMPWIGFPRTTVVGPLWLKLMTPKGQSLKSEFERLLAWRFDNLLSAHGSYLRGGAHEAVEAAVRRAFGG